jgi:uncharacterized protein YkwD
VSLKARTILTTFSTTLVVAVLAAAWAVASPMQVTCAVAMPLSEIAPAPDQSAQFVQAINDLRASKGLNALAVDGQLTNIAQDWAVKMAQDDGISHRLDIRAGISELWKRLGENVGVGPTVGQLMDAFIASPGHYKNLVDPTFTHIGVGTVRTSDGQLYTAHEFMALESSGPAVTVPPAPSPAPVAPRVRTTAAPKVTAPPVTAPPVTAPPTTVAPAPAPTSLEAAVQQLPADQQLHSSSQNDHKQQHSQSNGRCRSHSKNLQAIVL